MEDDTHRVGIVAVLLAVAFGIREVIPDVKFSYFSMELGLKVFADIFVRILLIYFMFFIILYGR